MGKKTKQNKKHQLSGVGLLDSLLLSKCRSGVRSFGVLQPLLKAVHRGSLSWWKPQNKIFTFIFQLSGWALVAPSCFTATALRFPWLSRSLSWKAWFGTSHSGGSYFRLVYEGAFSCHGTRMPKSGPAKAGPTGLVPPPLHFDSRRLSRSPTPLGVFVVVFFTLCPIF